MFSVSRSLRKEVIVKELLIGRLPHFVSLSLALFSPKEKEISPDLLLYIPVLLNSSTCYKQTFFYFARQVIIGIWKCSVIYKLKVYPHTNLPHPNTALFPYPPLSSSLPLSLSGFLTLGLF